MRRFLNFFQDTFNLYPCLQLYFQTHPVMSYFSTKNREKLTRGLNLIAVNRPGFCEKEKGEIGARQVILKGILKNMLCLEVIQKW